MSLHRRVGWGDWFSTLTDSKSWNLEQASSSFTLQGQEPDSDSFYLYLTQIFPWRCETAGKQIRLDLFRNQGWFSSVATDRVLWHQDATLGNSSVTPLPCAGPFDTLHNETGEKGGGGWGGLRSSQLGKLQTVEAKHAIVCLVRCT